MAGGDYKSLTIELSADTSGLNSVLRKSQTEANKLQRELKKVQNALKFDSSNSAAASRQFKLLEDSIESASKKLEKLRKIESEKGDKLNTDAWTKLQYEIGRAESDIEKFRGQLQQLVVDEAAANTSLGKAGASVTALGEKLDPVGQKMQSIGRTMTTHVTLPIVAAGTASMKAAVDIDTALTGVKKTVNGTEEQYEQLKQAAIEFSKTNAVSAEQVLNAQALGAQLGFTIDELDEFSRVATGMEIATDMGLEDAATQMAQFANITGMAHDDISRYASAIVNLGNNMATTESQVSSMAQRIAASGTQVRMTQSEILGWAGVMSSVGVEAEAGGTAFSNFVSDIDAAVATGSDDLQNYAEVAGMTADEFAQSWQESSTETLQSLLKGVAGADNMTVALEKMGVTGVRQSDVLKRLAGNSDLVSKSLSLANQGWTENTALANEVANRNESLAAKFEMLKNRVIAVAEEIGKPLADAMLEAIDAAEPLFEAIENGARAFSEMSDDEQKAVIQTVAIIAALGPALSVFGKAASSVKILGSAMTTLSKGLTTASLAMGNNIPSSASQGAQAVAKMGAQAKIASVATTALKGAAIGLAVAGIAVLATAIAQAVDDMQKFDKSTNGLRDAVSNIDTVMSGVSSGASAASGSVYEYGKAVRETSEAQSKLADKITSTFGDVNANAALAQRYVDTIKDIQSNYDGTAESADRLQAAVDGYNSVTGSSLEITDKTTGSLSQSTEALQANTDAWAANARAQAAQEMYQESFKNQIEIETKLADATQVLSEKAEAYNNTAGMSAEMQEKARSEYEAAAHDVKSLETQLDSAKEVTDRLAQKTDEYTQEATKAADITGRFRDALADATGDAKAFDNIADSLGMSADDLSSALEQAGISSEQLAKVGSDSFEELYQNADGDMDKIKTGLTAIEMFKLSTKDFEVTDKGTIRTKKGEVIDLNNRTINGKHFTVSDDGTISVANDRVNGFKANVRSIPDGYADIYANDYASGTIASIARKVANLAGAGVNIYASLANAAGGLTDSPIKIWAHADGGVGGIVDRPTITNVGLVGEDGAEAMLGNAIIPLTNKRYVAPFAETVAGMIDTTQGARIIERWLENNLPEIIATSTPVIGERDFGRAVRKVQK